MLGSCGETRLRVLQKLQNRAARIVSDSSFDTSATLLIENLKWLTFTDMIKSETAAVTYKVITGLTPSYLSNLFTKIRTEILMLSSEMQQAIFISPE